MSTKWQDLVEDKKKRQAATIPQEWLIGVPPESIQDVSTIPEKCGLLSEIETAITRSDVDVLLRNLAERKWSSVQVTTAFYKRAIIAHQLTNCLTEIFVEKALERAKELDHYLEKNGRVLGPLHGLPVSLKDQISLKGLETIMGYASWVGQYAEKNAALVDILCDAGAVPFVRTNVPQTLMWPETFNLVFGRTVNPYNRTLTSGGSSGGEGALIALHGSPLGVGSDVGGSVRIPAAMCGIYGLRPSANRIPYEGSRNSHEGQEAIFSSLGPLSNSVAGLKIFTKAVVDGRPWTRDPYAIRKPWDADAYALAEHGGGKKLVFGILWDDAQVVPHPPIIRALEMTKAALVATGHSVIDWTPLRHKDASDIAKYIWGSAANEDYANTVKDSGEPVLETMGFDAEESQTSASFRATEGTISAYELWQLHKRRRDYCKAYLDHWEATVSQTGTGRPVDAIISPQAPWTATPHGMNRSATYTTIYNVLNYTAAVFPVTQVDPKLDAAKPPHEFKSKEDKSTYELYNPEKYFNAPVGLQLVGRTLDEEAVLAMTEIVDAALKKHAVSKL